MKILFAPSEGKTYGGDKKFELSSLCFSEKLFELRKIAFDAYAAVLDSGDESKIAEMTGVKASEFFARTENNFCAKEVLHRYSGVAYEALDFATLPKLSQKYLKENLFVFSNLFGVVQGVDFLPYYKLKQGKTAGKIDTAELYKNALQKILDDAFAGECILDLRSGFYDKFYKPSFEYFTFKFLKGGKVVSHFAKYYRGLVLRECALRKAKNIGDLLQTPLNNLMLKDRKKTGNKTTLVFEIE